MVQNQYKCMQNKKRKKEGKGKERKKETKEQMKKELLHSLVM